ncbi:MAG: hypothetical protein LBE82_08010, partial [Chitinophagaceae bacterium]|nr:hypothetical protein [Chitinophagaceae bacterium]
INLAFLSIPCSIHEVAKPVPVPNSKIEAEGLDAAKVRNKLPVSASDAMLKKIFFVSDNMLSY